MDLIREFLYNAQLIVIAFLGFLIFRFELLSYLRHARGYKKILLGLIGAYHLIIFTLCSIDYFVATWIFTSASEFRRFGTMATLAVIYALEYKVFRRHRKRP